MRRTTELLPAADRRVEALAAASGRSISATIADLVGRGLQSLPTETIPTDPRTGFPVFSFGVVLTDEQIAKMIAED